MRSYRERAGLGREDLAELLGTTARTLQRVENEGLVGMSLLKQLCQILHLPAAAVLRQDADEIRRSLRSFGFAPGLPPALIGRDRELATIHDHLTRVDAHTVLVLVGPVGVGKTSLAQRVAQDLAQHFDDGVVWVHGHVAHTHDVQLDIARALGFDAHLPAPRPDGASAWTQAFGAHFWLGRRLLVLDDVTDPAQVQAFLGDNRRAAILATSRFRHVADEVATATLEIGRLDRPSVTELLAAGVDPSQLADPTSRERLLDLIDGMPGLAQLIQTALRRERLSTAASWLARFDQAARSGGDRMLRGALAYYDSLATQLSPEAWRLFGGLGVFGSEPVPVSWAGAASGLPPTLARAAASELLDAHVVNLYQAPDEADPEPWLRLATHPATAARAHLGAGVDDARLHVATHLVAELLRHRADSPPALVRYFRRHQALILGLRDALSEGLGAPPDLRSLESPAGLTAPPIPRDRARLYLDLTSALSPLLFDHTIATSGDWLGLALLATRSAEDPNREGLTYLFCGWWRVINVNLVGQPGWHEASRAAMGRAGNVLGCAALHGLLTMIHITTSSFDEAARSLDELIADLARVDTPSAERACVWSSVARSVMSASPAANPALEAARISRQALADLDLTATASPSLRAFARANLETYLRVAGEPNLEAFAAAITELRAHISEPWLAAALLGHAAALGAPLGFASTAEAASAARAELLRATRECNAEQAPRLLWFVATCGLYEMVRRASGGASPMVRHGIAGHGVPARLGVPVIPELCGNDLLLMLSTEATGAFLDLPYIDLALDLAAHVTDGRLVSPALRGLRDLLAT